MMKFLSKKERVSLLVDGANFYHLVLKKMRIDESRFDFDAFAEFVVRSRNLGPLGKRYYVGTVPERKGDPESVRRMSKQTMFLTSLAKSGWEVKTSKLRTRKEKITVDYRVSGYEDILKRGITEIEITRLREKGIDVKIAVDLLAGAFDNQYDTAILVSSDGDLMPAVDWVQKRSNKKVEYIGFSMPDPEKSEESTKPNLGLVQKAKEQRVLVIDELKQFIRPA